MCKVLSRVWSDKLRYAVDETLACGYVFTTFAAPDSERDCALCNRRKKESSAPSNNVEQKE